MAPDDQPDYEHLIQEALDSLPADLRRRIANVEIAVEDEPPAGTNLLGLYQGIPLSRRGSGYGLPQYSGALPDRITVFRRPLERHFGADPERLAQEIRHVVLHEIAHYFGISDERLIEIDRY
jgi:predicted Zn-dependent protease with MMP-like domain